VNTQIAMRRVSSGASQEGAEAMRHCSDRAARRFPEKAWIMDTALPLVDFLNDCVPGRAIGAPGRVGRQRLTSARKLEILRHCGPANVCCRPAAASTKPPADRPPMLKALWNSLTGTAENSDSNAVARIDRERLRMLIEHFPIGRKLRYYPEYQRDIVFNTLVVAYCINGEYVYARDAVEADAAGEPTAFLVGESRTRVPLENVSRFSLVVPDTSDMERTLDYIRRANIGRHGQFSRGNAITLLADAGQRGIPAVDTQVEKRIRMPGGPYADIGLIQLEPEFRTLTITDQRHRQRLQTDVPVDLFVSEDAPPVRCILNDFSEQSARLVVSEPGHSMPPMAPEDGVTVAFSLGDPPKTFMIRGVVFRRNDDSCVIKLQRLYQDGEFVNFRLFDMLEIKTGLLNYGH
jgi:hypothetical protein